MTENSRNTFFAVLIIASMAFSSSVSLAQPNTGESFTIYIENDTRRIGGPGSDDNYSNGLRLSYVYAEDQVPNWVPTLTDWSEDLRREFRKSSNTNFGISLGHQIFTPKDTQTETLITDDRPYAGWLYFGFMASYQTASHSHSLELDLGVVGPAAMGEQVQNNFHSLIDVEKAKGWNNQLDNEPTVQVSYQQRLRFIKAEFHDSRVADLIPYFGGAVGNVLIGAHVGSLLRVGFNIPDDFGPTRPSSTDGDPAFIPRSDISAQKWGGYLYGGLRGNLVAHNIFLDGSIFQHSHHVTKYPVNAETEFGVGGRYGGWSVVWRYVTKSPEFEERSIFNSFASISISYARSL